MPNEFDRRALLRYSALAGAGALTSPLWSGAVQAGAAIRGRTGQRAPADHAADHIVASVRRPRFPGRSFPVTRFGAVGDGATDGTRAFAAAIAACHQAGGGHVIVPPGQFLTGAIHLLSNVDLHLEAGSTILFSQDPTAYLPVVFTRWQGIELMNYSPLVYSYGQRNIAITGSGTLNGQADASHWWNWKSLETPDFTALEAMADAGVPVSQRVFGTGHYLPPQMIQPFLTDTVLIQGVTIINSPFWHMNPNLCTNVTVEGVTVNSSGPNTDGCDPESCDRVLIDGVTFSCGDDCIAIKSGRDSDGRRVGVPSTNLVVQNCTFASGHGGITLGSEMTGGVRNVYGRDLAMNSPDLQSGHRIKANTLRGGYVINSNVYRVTAATIGGPVLKIEGQYSGQTGNFPPDVTGITVADWTVGSCQGVWSLVGASASDPLGTITLEDIAVMTSAAPSSAQYVSNLVVEDVTVGGTPVTS
jgi:polygalacturonase